MFYYIVMIRESILSISDEIKIHLEEISVIPQAWIRVNISLRWTINLINRINKEIEIKVQ